MPLYDQHPDEVLLYFIERLPTTIRDVILARCCMAFGRLHSTPKQDLLGTFRAILKSQAGEPRAYMCAKVVAVVDLVLFEYDAGSGASLASELLETTGSHRFADIDIQAPLTQKHWRAARDEFVGLRRDHLNTQSLHSMLMDEVSVKRRQADSGQ